MKKAKPIMKKGQSVTVYEDPVTMEKIEGEATLLKFEESSADPRFEFWKVRFFQDLNSVYRWIPVQDA